MTATRPAVRVAVILAPAALLTTAYYLRFGNPLPSLHRWIFKRTFVLGQHHIEIDYVDIAGGNTDALREYLEKQCAGLTSNHKIGGLTTEESLVLSLLQHYSSCYWLNSLDYASLAVMKGFEWLDESTWNKFRATIGCHKQSKSITIRQVVHLLKKFQRFWAQQHPKSYDSEIICFGFYESSSSLSRQTFNLPENPATSSSPHPTHYLWYDGVTKCFDAITCLSNFYQDTASYWECLVLRAEICLDQFFQQEFVATSEEALEVRLAQLNDEVKSFGKTFDSFKQQFTRWKIGKEFDHLVLDMDHCIRWPDEDSKDSAPTWCEQLWQVMARCLSRQIEQALIDRNRKIEMNRRVKNIEIDKIRENVERLNWELAKARQRKSELDRRVADETQLLEKLAWSQLLLDLANTGFVPAYDLACQRKKHEIYKEKNASQLALKVFALLHPPSSANKEKRAALEKYVNNPSNKNQVLKELHSALDNYVGQEISNGTTRNHILTIDGEASVVLKKIASSVKLDGLRKIVINAQRVIYVDCDWKVPGISVTLSAPLIRIICSSGVEKRTITTSGCDGKEHKSLKAADGNGAGASGSHGKAGEDGEHAGNVRIDCQSFIGRLKIVARGGKGSDGQDGGNGQPGHKGSDGADGTFPDEPREGYASYLFANVRGIQLLYKSDGSSGKPGGNGGSGGNSGKGGRGGLGGQVHFVSSHHDRPTDSSQCIERDCPDGQNGEDGQPGRGAPGGTGGKHGLDAVLYFEPDSLWPIFNLTGHWRSHKGSIALEEIRFLKSKSKAIKRIGYKVINSEDPPKMDRRVADGQNGVEGKKAAHHLQLRSSNAAAEETASQFHGRRKTGKQDDGEKEWERRLEAIRDGERRRANEADSIVRKSRDIVGKQNAISHLEKALAIDRQRLENMNEIRQRVRSKMKETFEQRITQQSVVGQRITRQQKLNFKNDEPLVLAADASSSVSSTEDPGTNIRSGRPVSEQSTAPLRCLAKVDDLIKSLKDDDNKNLLTISQTVQSLVLNLSFDDYEKEWNSIEKIVNRNSKGRHPLKWVDSLEFVVSNLPLITSLADQSPTSAKLTQVLEKFLRTTAEDQDAAEMKDVICILNEFHQHQRPVTVQQVITLLSDIFDWTQHSHILLGLFFDKWMLSSITKTIFQVSANEELGQSRASLFAEVWLQCSLVSKWTKSTTAVQSFTDNEWFQHVGLFVSQLEVLRQENSILVDELLVKFARDRLGIIRNVSVINVEKRWQLFFVVDHFQPKVDEMDAIGQWARKNSDQQMMALVERAFNERFIAPIWSEIQSLIQNHNWTKDPKSGKIHEDVEKAIRRLHTASVSSFTSFSFGQKLELSRAVKENLEFFERLRGPDVGKGTFLYLIKSYSEKAEASTAELFVSSQSDCDDQAEIILSLLADSKKFEEKKVMLELHFRLSYLSDASFQPSQILKIAGILLNESSDRPISDDFNNYHWHCFRSTFLDNWSNYFFSHWSKCHQQTERLRDRIAGRNPEDDDRSLDTLELALEQYLLFTTGLPPLEAVNKWLKLQKLSSSKDRIKYIANDLEHAIQDIGKTITPKIDQLYSCKLLHLTEKENYGLIDLFFEINLGAPISFYDDTHSVQSLLDVIEAVQWTMDLTNDLPQTHSISPAELGEWKKKLVQWKVIDREAAYAVHFAVKELVETTEWKLSSGDNYSRKIYEHIAARRRHMLHKFDQELSWLQTFVGYLADSRSGITTLKVIKATVETSQFLSWNELKNGKTSLVQVVIDISAACNLIPKPVVNSWNWFFGAILNLNISERTIWLVTTMANFIGGQLSNDRKGATWNEAKRWFSRLDSLIDYTSRAADVKNHWEEVMRIQQVLIDYCSACYETKLLADCEKRSKNKMDLNLVCFTFKNVVDRCTNVVRFVRSKKEVSSSRQQGSQTEFLINQLETRQLVLKALIQLGQSNSFYWDEETVNRFLKDLLLFPELKPSPYELCILSNMLVSGPRKAVIERWISLESCWEPERIRVLVKSLQDKNLSLNDAQLLFSIAGYDIFNDEEKSYIKLINDNAAVESSLLVDDQHPSCFLGVLQKLAIERIRAEFVRCFEPFITVQDMDRYLPKPSKASVLQGTLVDKQHVTQLCRSFNRLIRTKKEQGEELLDWLHWIRDVVVPSLKSYEIEQGLSVQQITKLFEDAEEFPLDLCRSVTTGCRPRQWIDMLAIFAIEDLLDQLTDKCRKDQIKMKSSDIVQQLVQWWASSGAPTSFLHIFYHKIRQEMAGDPHQLMTLVQELTNKLTALKLHSLLHEDVILGRFCVAPITYWPSVMRCAQLVVDWAPDLALRLTSFLDVQFGQERTDQFLRLVVHRHPELNDKSDDHKTQLRIIMENMIRFPWITDQWMALIDQSLLKKTIKVSDPLWHSLSDLEMIETEMKKSSRVDLSVDDILSTMSRDPESSKVIGNSSEMAQLITRIRQEAKNVNVGQWTEQIKKKGDKTLKVDDFLAVACRVIHDKKGYVPRDVQLIAVVAFVSSDDQQQQTGRMPRRMGEVSTGEGKTLISALVAIYHVLRYWNVNRHVNIITSSPVLAEANIAEIGWLFQSFGVSVSNNCDQKCSNDEDVRRERYNNDVIYGDLGSFMRDILLTRFFEDKDVTRNRNPGAIIVDEVDSLTLDKGENVLYMSHNIPEMYDLVRLFVEIWTTINAPDVVHLAESNDIVDEIRQLIEPRISDCVPNGIKKFAERYLSTWIKSAFRACYLLQPNDAYKVDDCGDGQGRRIVIMDKETGVEQTQTEWSDGLQQFLQLKHGMKWTPISLKAIFMSNIGYFSEFEGRMYGLTGTLGSTAECDLLRHVFGVDFFRLPRFRQRFCIQHEPIIAHGRQHWLDQMKQVVVNIASMSYPNQQRAVLVVCENIESADSIYERLKSSDDDGVKVVKYTSSFDEAFKVRQQQEILPGQVMITTNLAGRGTDLKPSQKLVANGGLHVIIGFLPPNARVEAQAEGRTARGGQPGSFQFVIHQVENNAANNRQAKLIDPYGRLLELKSKRDDDERLRLDNIRRETLPKIQLEEELFHEYYKKCVAPLGENKSHLHLQQQDRKIKRSCLNNRWALWLDENSSLIEKAHHNSVVKAKLKGNFKLLTMSVQSSDVESIVSSPSEWMMFARFYEESSKPDSAARCYSRVASMEPKWCENALLDCVRLVLADSANFEKKMVAKGYLKRARQLIDDRIQVLASLSQQVDQCLNRQMERGSALCHKRFEEQINNQIRLWRIHASQIDNLLGVPFKCALAAVLPTENDQHIDQVIELLGNFMKPRRYSKKADKSSFDWPPFVAHCREPLMELVKNGQNCKLSDFENAIGRVERNLWTSLISVYIDKGQETGGGKIIQAYQYVGREIPDTIKPESYRRILPGWLKFHDGQEFSLVSSTLGLEDSDQLKKLEKWLEYNKVLQDADKCFRHRLLKPIPSMDQDPDAELVKGVALSSCADVVAAWFSSPIVEGAGSVYVLRPLFDERKKKLAKQFLDYLIDVGVVKDPAIRFPSARNERSREEMKEDLDKIKGKIDSLYGLNQLAKLFYGTDEKVLEEKKEDVKALSNLEQSIKGLLPPTVSSLVVPAANEVSTALNNLERMNRQPKEANALKEKKGKLSTALMQAIGIHLGQLKTLAQVKSSFCSLHTALPPPGDDPSSPTDEIHQFNHQQLDRVLLVDEYVSRWDWRVGAVALFGVAQLVGAMYYPFFGEGLVGEGINDLMFAFQCLLSPGSFSWNSYLADKGKSLAVTAFVMGVGTARLVKACGGSLKQAGKMMLRFNGTLKVWSQAGKKILFQCASVITSSIIGQAVNRFLTWLNKFILEQVLERIKSSLFNNLKFRPAFAQLKGSMKSLMIAMVKSGKSASEATQIILQVLNGAKNKLATGDWFTELCTNASSITSRMMRIFSDSTAGLSNLRGSYVSEYQSHARTQNTQGITAATNAGTVEMAINMGKTIVDYGQKAAEVVNRINTFTTTCQTVTKLATHGTTYVGDLNSALQDELRALRMKSQQEPAAAGQSGGELSKEEAERFEELIDETEGEIQSSIMKTTLDTIQTAWLQPMIQLKIEQHISKIGSKLVKKYCPSLLPEGFDNKGDESKNSGDDDEIPSEDGWIDDMGNGNKLARPIEMQNAVDAYGFVLEIQDETGQYTKGTGGDKFTYHPDGNPYSNKPVVKMSFTENEDGSKHVCLIMPDGTKHEYVPDPSDPPDRCFYNALSKAQGDPSVDHTIQKLKTHAKGNDRARFMSKLGVNQSYQHLQAGRPTNYVDDNLGRTVRIITTETERQQERNADPARVMEIRQQLGFRQGDGEQPGDVYSHDIALNSGGVDDLRNISRMSHECNRFSYRKHEMNFENFREYNQQSESPEVITRVITRYYRRSVAEIRRMERNRQIPDRNEIVGYRYNFYTGPPDNPTYLYKSGFIPNYSGQQTRQFIRTARRSPITGRVDVRGMRQENTRRGAANVANSRR